MEKIKKETKRENQTTFTCGVRGRPIALVASVIIKKLLRGPWCVGWVRCGHAAAEKGKEKGAAGAWTSDPGVSYQTGPQPSDGDQIKSSAVRFKAREQMLQVCCEPLRAMLRAGCVQHPNINRPSPSSHVATMLRPVLRATSNISSSPPPPPRHNIICM
jgi:hypothetical protein